jgi:hypothetical protein
MGVLDNAFIDESLSVEELWLGDEAFVPLRLWESDWPR